MGDNTGSLVKIGIDLGITAGYEGLKGKTFRIFNKGGTNFSPKIYSGWKGGSAGEIKTYGLGGATKLLNYAGKGLGYYGMAGSIYDTATGKCSIARGGVDLGFGALGVWGGWQGALISASYELGKVAGPSKWFD
ncbi:hypothetical protein [Flavobacterium pallidum]|uniref:Uncharacterized protein n=1 Tax=Flavobacterium pallidum TaxID=2172098 RepID=A0A2S1SGH8_9FLAO|nr:hypothetical protein [Flavobacterium pallidum]AWI25514.1 hypothetical protein HYN49_06170 [Flavobacterium pallidum]